MQARTETIRAPSEGMLAGSAHLERDHASAGFWPLKFPLSSSHQRALFIVADLLALNAALGVFLVAAGTSPVNWRLMMGSPLFSIWGNLLWILTATAFDAYGQSSPKRFRSFLAPSITTGILAPLIFVLPVLSGSGPSFSPIHLLWLPVLIVVFLVPGRFLCGLMRVRAFFQRRVLIVGAGWAGRSVFEATEESGGISHTTVGFIDDDPGKLGQAVFVQRASGDASTVEGQEGCRLVLGSRHDLHRIIESHRITTVVLAITHNVDGGLRQILSDIMESGVEIVSMPVLYEQVAGRVPVDHIGDNWLVAMPVCHPGHDPVWRAVKRTMDFVLAGAGLVLFGLMLPLLSVLIYLDSPGPIFYSQRRVGRGGRIFKQFKLRSMVRDAETNGAVWASRDDPRVTRVGKILRKTHIDEFPQFLNIIKGDMSAVGPRPERPEFVEELAEDIPFFRVRNAVKPGMAGWGLVRQGYGASKHDALLKLQYDLYYIKHQSFRLDVEILAKTILDTLRLRGR